MQIQTQVAVGAVMNVPPCSPGYMMYMCVYKHTHTHSLTHTQVAVGAVMNVPAVLGSTDETFRDLDLEVGDRFSSTNYY